VDGADEDEWSAAAEGWDRWWDDFPLPVWDAVLDAVSLETGMQVLDVGCGSGGLLRHLAGRGFVVAGADPAEGMRERARAGGIDVRDATAEELPWADGTFDLTIAVNALQLADDTLTGVREMARVTAPGGHVAVANWAEGSLNELEVIERAMALADGDEVHDDDALRRPGGLHRLLVDGGLHDVRSDLTAVPWVAADDDALVSGILFGEDPATMASYAPTVLDAARSFRRGDGSYRLINHFRHAIGCTPRATR